MGHSGSNLGHRPLLLLLPLAALAGVAVWQLLRPLGMPDPPAPEGWLDAALHVKSGWQAGDVVRIEPTWLTAGRVYFGDVDGGPRTPFRVLDLHAPVDLPFLYGFQRLWLVAAVDRQGKRDGLPEELFEAVEQTAFPGLTVTLFQVRQGLVRWRMPANASRAAGGARSEIREVAGGPRQCLLVRPEGDGKEVVLRFGPLDVEGQLLVRAGNTVEAARSKDGGTVRVEVSVDGAPAGEVEIERSSYRFDAVTHSLAGAGPHELAIRLTTADERKREVCLDGFVLAPEAVR